MYGMLTAAALLSALQRLRRENEHGIINNKKMGLPEKKHKEFELRKEKACQMICHHFRLIH